MRHVSICSYKHLSQNFKSALFLILKIVNNSNVLRYVNEEKVNCSISIKWNTVLKNNYWYVCKQHGWISKELCWVKENRWKRVHTIWSCLYKNLESANSTIRKQTSGCLGMRVEGYGRWGTREGLQGIMRNFGVW